MSSWSFASFLFYIPAFPKFPLPPCKLSVVWLGTQPGVVGDTTVTYSMLGGHRAGLWGGNKRETTVPSRAVAVLAALSSTGALLHPGEGWEWDLLLPGSSTRDFTLEATPEFVTTESRGVKWNPGQAANLPDGNVLPSLFSPLLFLFVCQAPRCDSPFSPQNLNNSFLLQQICRERCPDCSVTKLVLEMEKALFKENMTFRWKSNFACCF